VPRAFVELTVYRIYEELADELHLAVAAWPPDDRWTTGKQLMRAVDSIGANIAEATGRDTDADRRRMLFVARGSSHEVQHWLRRAARRGLPTAPKAPERADQVGRMINGMIRALTTSDQRPATSD
jgi:four helix bundle protein